MAIMTASAGEQVERGLNKACKALIYDSIARLSRWLEENDYRGHDTFEGLSARLLRPFYDSESLSLAVRVAQWTIEHMRDRTEYFYYGRYSRWIVNKTPTLHWGQATMLCALAGLYVSL